MGRKGPLKKTLRAAVAAVKWLVVVAVMIEVSSFLIITVSNAFLYGSLREGSRVRYDPYALYLNKAGPKPTPGCPAPSGLRKPVQKIWMFGGSTMRGDSREGDPTIPALLSHMLNGPDSPLHFEFWNFGENSFNSLLEVNYLQKRLIEGNDTPDVILFYDGANDAVYLAQYRTPYGHHGYRRFRSMVESYHRSLFGLLKPLNAAIYSSFTREIYDKTMQTLVPLEEDSALVRDFARLTEQRYDDVYRTARSLGAEFVLILQPNWWAETAEVTPHVVSQEKSIMMKETFFPAARRNVMTVYGALSQRLQGKPYFIDFRNALTERVEPVYRADGVHVNGAGRRMAAERIAGILEKRGCMGSTMKPAP